MAATNIKWVATNIKWDLDGYTEEEKEDLKAALPVEMEIPDNIAKNSDEISDYISDTTGFCHKGYSLTSLSRRNLAEELQTIFDVAYEGNQPFATRGECVDDIEKGLDCTAFVYELIHSLDEINKEYHLYADKIKVLRKKLQTLLND